jgi:hypothetical protein
MVESPNVSSAGNYLNKVAVISPTDVWAVGYYDAIGSPAQTLTLHWNGVQWSVMPSPNVGSGDNVLSSVVAISSNDVWAVGNYQVGNNSHTLTIHWDGTAWSVVPTPAIGANSFLFGVDAVSNNEVWAVGNYTQSGSTSYTLTMRWDGSIWTIVPTTDQEPYENRLYDVEAISSTDVWAVGRTDFTYSTLVMHWNGSAWTRFPSPNPGPYDNVLRSVDAVSPDNIWAVGYAFSWRVPGEYSSLIQHWDGTSWRVVEGPDVESNDILFDVADIGPDNVWATGTYNNGRPTAFIAHWDGTWWRRIDSYSPESEGSFLYGIDAFSPTELWAVGVVLSVDTPTHTLVERYNDPCVTPTPTSTPTSTPTYTPTSTHTPTPIICTIQFSDVPPNHTFYTFIRCLACRGILGGYADGTFRPGNPTTRGQMAKIIANAAGILDPIPPNRQTFSDVPPGHTFWVYIERLSARGIVGGYADGTFRPDNWVTRGQLTKFAANAAGFSEPIPPNQQTYTDVPPTHTFWEYVERLSGRGVISGYQCGVPPAGACDPQNRAWFLPDATVTRGQTSKIVANTFYPNCQTP